MIILQKNDLASASFSNDGSNATGGVAVRTDASSQVGGAVRAAKSTKYVDDSGALTSPADATAAIAAADTAAGVYPFGVPAGDYRSSQTTPSTYTGPGTISKLDGSLAPNFTKLGNIGSDGDKNTRVLYGAIRQSTAGAGWTFIDDAAHTPNGFLPSIVTNADGTLTVLYNFTAEDVGTFIATQDETFAALGIQIGASVGLSSATISLFKNMRVDVNLSTLVFTPSTWFAGKVSIVNNGNGTVTITHPAATDGANIPELTFRTRHQTIVSSYSSTTVTLESLVAFGGYVAFDGANWVVATPCFNKPTAVFNAGVLTVTHQTLDSVESQVQITGRDNAAGVGASLVSAAPTAFAVAFRDAAGALITTPNTNMRFWFQGPQMLTREVPVGTLQITRANCTLDAADVAAAGGNIWLYGAMVVA